MKPTNLPNVNSRSSLYCIGQRAHRTATPTVYAPARNDVVRIVSFCKKRDAIAFCKHVNNGGSSRVAHPELSALNFRVIPIVTCINDLVEAGWRRFGIDECAFDTAGNNVLIGASTVFNCEVGQLETVVALEKMFVSNEC
jgi:hypothetical protein